MEKRKKYPRLKNIIIVIALIVLIVIGLFYISFSGFIIKEDAKNIIERCNDRFTTKKDLFNCYKSKISDLKSFGVLHFYENKEGFMEFLDLREISEKEIIHLTQFTIVGTIDMGDERYTETDIKEYLCEGIFRNFSEINDRCTILTGS